MAIASKNILIEIPDPVDSVVQIDLRDYFGGDSFEIIDVSDINSSKAEHIYISTDAQKLSYHPNPNCGLWGYPVLSTDSFSYTIKDLTDESESTGTITLTKTEVSENFVAQDVFIHMNNPVPNQIKVDIIEFNQHTDAQLVSFGEFDENYVDDIKIASDNSNELIIDLNLENQWDHNDDKTFVEFTLRDLESGDSDKAKLYISRSVNSFTTPQINIDLEGREPGEYTFDFNGYNIPFGSKFISAGISNPEAGTVEIIDNDISDYNDDYDAAFGPIERTLKFNFNMESGFWGSAKASAAIRYTVKKDDNFSSNYLIIHKDNNTAENTYTVDLKMSLATYLTKINRLDSVVFAHLFRAENLTIDATNKVSQSSDLIGDVDFEQLTASSQPTFEAPNLLLLDGSQELENTEGLNIFTSGNGSIVFGASKIGENIDGNTYTAFSLIDTPYDSNSDRLTLSFVVSTGINHAPDGGGCIEYIGKIDGVLKRETLSGELLSDVMGDPSKSEGLDMTAPVYTALWIDELDRVNWLIYGKTLSGSLTWGQFIEANDADHGWFGKQTFSDPKYLIGYIGTGSGHLDGSMYGIAAFSTANFSTGQFQKILNLLIEDQQLTPANDFLKTIEDISSIDRVVFASNFLNPDFVQVDDSGNVERVIDLSSFAYDAVWLNSKTLQFDATNGLIANTSNEALVFKSENWLGRLTDSQRGHILFKTKAVSGDYPIGNTILDSYQPSGDFKGVLRISFARTVSTFKIKIFSRDNNSPTGISATSESGTEFNYNQEYCFDLYWNSNNELKLRVDGIEDTNGFDKVGTDTVEPRWLGTLENTAIIKRWNIFGGGGTNDMQLKGLVIIDTETTNLTIAESQSIFDKMIAP